MEEFSLSKTSLKRITDIEPILQELIKRVIERSPYDFGIPQDGGKRTDKRQNELFLKGVSKCDGYKKKSYHQSGRAFDIFVLDEHGACWDCKYKYREIADVFKQEWFFMQISGEADSDLTLCWGGDWIFKGGWYDLPHFELR